MATTPEGKVKAKIRRLFKKHGLWWCCPMGTGYGSNGVPDFIACHRGILLAVEAKAGKNKPTKLQQVQLDQIQKSGGIAMVVNESNLDVLEKVIVRVTEIRSLSGRATDEA